MSTLNLLFKNNVKINDQISILIPKVGQILDDEDAYYSAISLLTAMPIDMLVQLDDAGIDFTTINEYELFLLMFPTLKNFDLSLVFENLDLSNFDLAINESDGSMVLIDSVNDIKIDRITHSKISSSLRSIHQIDRNFRKPANEEAKKYMIKRAREKARRNKNRTNKSQLESLIIAMVNTEQYKYDFVGTRELTIYQFNESVRQVINKVDYDNRMYGVYTGNISVKDLSQDELNWLTHK